MFVVYIFFFFFFFFFKQKTAYEIMPSLVGSEMCIRDRYLAAFTTSPEALHGVSTWPGYSVSGSNINPSKGVTDEEMDTTARAWRRRARGAGRGIRRQPSDCSHFDAPRIDRRTERQRRL